MVASLNSEFLRAHDKRLATMAGTPNSILPTILEHNRKATAACRTNRESDPRNCIAKMVVSFETRLRENGWSYIEIVKHLGKCSLQEIAPT